MSKKIENLPFHLPCWVGWELERANRRGHFPWGNIWQYLRRPLSVFVYVGAFVFAIRCYIPRVVGSAICLMGGRNGRSSGIRCGTWFFSMHQIACTRVPKGLFWWGGLRTICFDFFTESTIYLANREGFPLRQLRTVVGNGLDRRR